MSIIEHILLFFLLFLFYFLWGKYSSSNKDNVKFWLQAVRPILLYALIVGSRYGWGPDYISYKYRMEHAFSEPDEQIGFRWLNQLINVLGLNYVGGYIVYSLIFVICAFVLIRSYGKQSRYMYAFFVPATLFFVSAAIRQGIALSFLFLAIYFFHQKKWIQTFLMILIGISIHTATLIPVAFICIIYLFFRKKLFDWRITIPLYIYLSFFFDGSSIGFIASYFKYFSLDNKFQNYINEADRWFGVEGAESKYAQSTFALITSSLFYISFIYLGYRSLKLKPNEKIIYIYNTVVFGVLLYRTVFLYEILRRFAEPLVLLYFISISYIIYVYEGNKRYNLIKNGISKVSIDYRVYLVGLLLIVIYHILYWGRFIFLNPGAKFFWNN
ncbi:EpsG family protein [Emticicia sp. BO119]|uniref:EpsG family protein n=1 Tax=Emticicia sp. BO119 TaxID=2757768 RepID=UPI0015F0D3D6|nr:EpsG family protein [Emticicia sp. BO119]MBA4850521.1 EpsG family protein [Emticicia sp. BO119]